MNKKVIVIIAVVLVIAAIAGMIFLKIKKESNTYLTPPFIEQKINSFNDAFNPYQGNERSATQVADLYSMIISINKNYDEEYHVTMIIDGIVAVGENETDGIGAIAKLNSKNKYTIVCEDNDNNNCIDTVTVTTEE